MRTILIGAKRYYYFATAWHSAGFKTKKRKKKQNWGKSRLFVKSWKGFALVLSHVEQLTTISLYKTTTKQERGKG
jgi:hypothetical protein